MVKLRLKRMGKTHYPIYKIVAADSRFPRDGRFIEAVGTYNPNLDPMLVTLKEERIKYWLGVGAQPTDTVRNLFKSEGLVLRLHLEKKGLTAEEIETEVQKFLSEKGSKIARANEKKTRRKLAKKAKATEAKVAAETKAAPPKVEAKAPEIVAEAKAPEVVAEVKAPEVVTEVKAPEVVAEVKAPEVVAEVKVSEEVAKEVAEVKAPEVTDTKAE